MDHDVNAFNLLRFGLLPGIAILVFTLLITAQWSIALELLIIAAIPLLLGCLVLSWMFSSFGSDINQRLNDSIEKAKYLRPSYILGVFVLVSMSVAVLHILWSLSPNITLPLTLLAGVLITLVLRALEGHSPQVTPFTSSDQEEDSPITDYSYGYRGDWENEQEPQQPLEHTGNWHAYEQPQSQYPQSQSPRTR